MQVTLLNAIAHRGVNMVSRSLSDIAFSGAKQLLVGSREQLGTKDAEFDSKILQSFKLEK